MSLVLLMFCLLAAVLAPAATAVDGQVLHVCATPRDHRFERVSTVRDTASCSLPAATRARGGGLLILTFWSSDRGLLTARGVGVHVDVTTRVVSLVPTVGDGDPLSLPRRFVVFVEVPATELPPCPFVIRDAEGDTEVGCVEPP